MGTTWGVMDLFDDAFGAGDPAPVVATATPAAEQDPAADFLNREQNDLGDLGLDFGLAPAQTSAPTPTPTPTPTSETIPGLDATDGTSIFLDISNDVEAYDVQDNNGGGGGLLSSSEATSEIFGVESSVPATNGPGLFETSGNLSEVSMNGFSEMDGGVADMGVVNGMGDDPMEKGGPFENARSNPRLSGEEPECIRKWREEQKERIRIKDEEEEKKKEELRQKAKQELESWYKNYEEELQVAKKENRIAEEAFLEDVHGLKPGTEWERVCRNSNFNSKVNHNKKDRSRLKNVLLQLKQTPLMNRT